MNAVDYVLVVLALLAGLSGWRNGLVGGVLSFAGFIGGALVGALIAPHLVGSLSGVPAAALGIGVIVVAAGIGNALAGVAGSWIRAAVTWRPARFVDSLGGALFGVLSLALVAWVVASAILVVPLGAVSTEVRGSRVLGGIDALMPQAPRDWLSGLRSALDSTGFPQAFGGFTLDPVIPVPAPDPALLKDPAVRAAMASLVKVEGIAPDCGTQVDGSGFVFAKERVMTNAHVVAGVVDPVVLVGGTGRSWRARVVYLDPRVDVAVLEVPGLPAPSLSFSTAATSGDPAVVAGFPGGGSLSVTAARVRARISARGTDIYGNGVVVRDIYSVRGTVRPGNSGGPLLSAVGKVYGVVFASSVDDPDTGYALTADEVSAAARVGATADTPVATGSCATR
ncbi:MAG TPA: MarP family serine protease [Candidatus Angelobacter sp.]|nr:MarP family serine protease [Candidatus Angelobacter sp.]